MKRTTKPKAADSPPKKKTAEDPRTLQMIAVGFINNTEFIEKILPRWDMSLAGTPEAYYIITWSIEYFHKYKEAPRRHIEDIYYQKKKGREIPADLEESIREDLEDLAQEYDEEFNLQYVLDQTSIYLKREKLDSYRHQLKELIEDNDLDSAIEFAANFTPPTNTGTVDFDAVTYTSTEFCERKIPAPAMLLRPWLTEQSLNLVYGPRGSGKTWLCSMLAVALTRQDSPDVENIGSWNVSRPAGVLFIDGEMNNHMLQERLRDLQRPLPPEDPKNPLYIMSGHDYANVTENQLNLDKSTRKAIYDYLHSKPEIKVVVLDNASALTPGIVENSKEDWDPVNQWLISLRHLGVSVILVHHASKEGRQRGTSGREDAMDTILKVEPHKEYNQSEDNAWFTIKFEKSRNMKPGASKRDFSIRILPHSDGGLTWEQDNEGTEKETKRQIKEEILLQEMKQKEIAEEFGISPGRVSQIKEELIGEGYLKRVTRNGKKETVLTEKGEDFLD